MTTIKLAHRTTLIQASPTMALNKKAKALQAAGRDIINLSLGEPDFHTPKFIREAAIAAINKGHSPYVPAEGTHALREAIVQKFKNENQLHYTPEQIIVSAGVKHSFYSACQVLLEEGDEVIIPAPYWTSYTDMVRVTGAMPVVVTTTPDENFTLSPEKLERAITPKTKILLLNSPSNPTGICYRRQDYQALAAVLEKHPKILIITDDIYEHIYWGKEPYVNINMACPALHDRTLVMNGFSKAYAMPGWRLGYTATTHHNVLKAMQAIQSQSANASLVSMHAGIAALTGDQSCVQQMRDAFKARYTYVSERLSRFPLVKFIPAEGAFYIFLNAKALIEKLEGIHDDWGLSTYLLEKYDIALTPGSVFGYPDFLRISYAIHQSFLEKALDRLETVCNTANNTN